MAKKLDLESAFRTCSSLSAEATRAEEQGEYATALRRAESCLPLLREFAAYLRRYQKVETPRLLPVELLLRLAPPMMAGKSLDAVSKWFAESSRSERKAYAELPTQLEAARQRLQLAVRLWPHWQPGPVALSRPEERNLAHQLLDFWVRFGAVAQRSDAPEFQLLTHPKRPTIGKCFRCGRTDKAAWAEFLAPRTCTHCRGTSEFVIVARIA